jgi:hypothetical protein
VHGYNEKGIRDRYDAGANGDWPDPVMTDTFPNLEGTDLWDAFTAEDARRKQERIQPDEDEDEEELSVPEYAEQVKEDGIRDVVSVHGGNGTLYIDSDLIEVQYGVSGNKAKKISKVLKKEAASGELELEGLA